jgi:hypothetical protein
MSIIRTDDDDISVLVSDVFARHVKMIIIDDFDIFFFFIIVSIRI